MKFPQKEKISISDFALRMSCTTNCIIIPNMTSVRRKESHYLSRQRSKQFEREYGKSKLQD